MPNADLSVWVHDGRGKFVAILSRDPRNASQVLFPARVLSGAIDCPGYFAPLGADDVTSVLICTSETRINLDVYFLFVAMCLVAMCVKCKSKDAAEDCTGKGKLRPPGASKLRASFGPGESEFAWNAEAERV